MKVNGEDAIPATVAFGPLFVLPPAVLPSAMLDGPCTDAARFLRYCGSAILHCLGNRNTLCIDSANGRWTRCCDVYSRT